MMTLGMQSYRREIAHECAANEFGEDAINYGIDNNLVNVTYDPFSDSKRIMRNYSKLVVQYQKYLRENDYPLSDSRKRKIWGTESEIMYWVLLSLLGLTMLWTFWLVNY